MKRVQRTAQRKVSGRFGATGDGPTVEAERSLSDRSGDIRRRVQLRRPSADSGRWLRQPESARTFE